eukprot:6128465-Pleurochrysis_carterae.AAC.1
MAEVAVKKVAKEGGEAIEETAAAHVVVSTPTELATETQLEEEGGGEGEGEGEQSRDGVGGGDSEAEWERDGTGEAVAEVEAATDRGAAAVGAGAAAVGAAGAEAGADVDVSHHELGEEELLGAIEFLHEAMGAHDELDGAHDELDGMDYEGEAGAKFKVAVAAEGKVAEVEVELEVEAEPAVREPAVAEPAVFVRQDGDSVEAAAEGACDAAAAAAMADGAELPASTCLDPARELSAARNAKDEATPTAQSGKRAQSAVRDGTAPAAAAEATEG